MCCSGVLSNSPNNICKCMYIRGVKNKYTEHQCGGQSPPDYLSHLHSSQKLKQFFDTVTKMLKMMKNKEISPSLQAYLMILELQNNL